MSNQPHKNTTTAANAINFFRKEKISRQAYCKRSNNIGVLFYERLLKEIDNYINNNFKMKNHMTEVVTQQIYAVDGTSNNLLCNLTGANFKKNKNGSITAESMA